MVTENEISLRSGNFTSSQWRFKSLKEVRKKWNFKSTFYGPESCCIGRVFFMKLNNMLMLGFERNQSFLHVTLRNYQFIYISRNLLWGEHWWSPLLGVICEIVNSVGQGNFTFVRKKSGNFRNFSLWQPCIYDPHQPHHYRSHYLHLHPYTTPTIATSIIALVVSPLPPPRSWICPSPSYRVSSSYFFLFFWAYSYFLLFLN